MATREGARLDGLRSVGFTALWLPPCSKAMNARSMGYAPFDFFDLGELDQRGAVPTWLGTKEELVGLIAAAHARGMQVYADAVCNYMSGGDMEHNPDFNCDRWTRFRPASGQFAFDYRCFHPSRYQRWTGRRGATCAGRAPCASGGSSPFQVARRATVRPRGQ